MTDRPNIIMVVGEHFNGLIAPPNHPPVLKLENLEKLAGEGTVFARAYCNSPVCGPSRMSMLSGLMPCHNDTFDNGSTLPAHIPTFAHLLTSLGYETAMCGRMHVHGLDQHKGFEKRLVSEIINPMVAQKADWPSGLEPITALAGGTKAPPLRVGSPSPIYRHDEYVTAKAVGFLSERENPQRPFLLTVGYLAAHPGGRDNPAYQDWYRKYLASDSLPLLPFAKEDYHRLPESTRRYLAVSGADHTIFDPECYRREMAIYFAGLSFLDEQLGQILDTVDSCGLRENTIICFVADHGENMGTHGRWGKMNFYEEAVRVPLMMRGPSIPAGRLVEDPVSLVDILPTLVEWAGGTVETPCDGRSLRPLLNGGMSTPRPILSEYHGYLSPCGGYMLLENDWKLVHYPCQMDEFYDLRETPLETTNRIADPRQERNARLFLSKLQSAFGLPSLEDRVEAYNRQRDATAHGLLESAEACERTISDIAKYRETLAEPWWDGGQYMMQWESALYRHRK